MRKMLLTLLIVAALVIGIGFYLNWFSWTPKAGDGQTNVPIQVDTEKIETDVERAKEKAKDITEKAREKITDMTKKAKGGDDNEKSKDPAPAEQTKEKDQ